MDRQKNTYRCNLHVQHLNIHNVGGLQYLMAGLFHKGYRMKGRHTWIPASMMVILTALFFGCEVQDRIKIDGASIEMIGLMTLMNTQYSADYSHSRFRRIRLGITEQEVLDILGAPLSRIGPYSKHPCGSTQCPGEGHYLSLVYSKPPNLRNTNYRARVVTLNNGVVVEIYGRFSAD